MYTIASKQDGWMTFSTLPFFKSRSLSNITLISQNLLGTSSTVTFSNSRFTINKTKYGINLISNDKAIEVYPSRYPVANISLLLYALIASTSDVDNTSDKLKVCFLNKSPLNKPLIKLFG
nr:MAG TPA: hypothetical protein [Caudoviricetes sp.]